MLRELSEDVRALVKDRLRELRSVVRQHRHDRKPAGAGSTQEDRPFPVRELEGVIGHAVSVFDDAMTFAERFAPRPASDAPVFAPRPLQAYFRTEAEERIGGARAFRRDLYRLGRLCLERKDLAGLLIHESSFAAVHAALLKREGAAVATLSAPVDPERRVALVSDLCAALFMELVEARPIRLPVAEDGSEAPEADRAAVSNCLAAIVVACGLATLDMEGSPGQELMEVATLGVDARAERFIVALEREDRGQELADLFENLLVHLN